MKSPYFIKIVRLPEGDDLPMMKDSETGALLFYPTVFIATQRRMNRSPLTQEKDLRNIMVLYTWAQLRDLDIEDLFFSGDFLNANECHDLIDAARLHYEDLLKLLYVKKRREKKKTKIVKLKHYLTLPDKNKLRQVGNNTAASRIFTIADYLKSLADQRLHRISSKQRDLYRYLQERIKDVIDYLKNNAPEIDRKPMYELPMGISPADERFLYSVISPESNLNPFYNPVVKIRNELIVKLSFIVGMRRGEILALKTIDIDHISNRLYIEKRPDDPEDNRKIRPRQKTLPRVHPLAPDFSRLLRRYIINYRKTLRRGKVRKLDHSFVFVSVHDGNPLSVKMANEIFTQLRSVPGMPQELTIHTGRRNWNDRFSVLADKNRLLKQREQTIRNYLMGWNQNSEMAQLYSRRHVIQRAINYQRKHAEEWYNTNIATNQQYENILNNFYKGNDDLPDIPF